MESYATRCLKLKRKFYRVIGRPTLMYGAECLRKMMVEEIRNEVKRKQGGSSPITLLSKARPRSEAHKAIASGE